MAVEVRIFSVTIPKGTPVAAPIETQMAMPARIVEAVEIRIPPGPRGVVGFQLASKGSQVIPVNAGAFLIGDNEVIYWGLENTLESGAWSCIAYNTGTYNHTLQFRFKLGLVRVPVALVSFAPLAAEILHGQAPAPTGPGAFVNVPPSPPSSAGFAIAGSIPGVASGPGPTPEQLAAAAAGQTSGTIAPGKDGGTPLGGRG
jgi:hypothetical protein